MIFLRKNDNNKKSKQVHTTHTNENFKTIILIICYYFI